MTKTDNIELTAKQLKMAELLANPEEADTKTALCEKVGVSRETFYKWLKKKEFIDYVSELIDHYTDGELASVWKSLIKQCQLGNVAAIKLYFEMKGKYKQTVDLGGRVVVFSGEDKLG